VEEPLINDNDEMGGKGSKVRRLLVNDACVAKKLMFHEHDLPEVGPK
jgi:hypothetical protein